MKLNNRRKSHSSNRRKTAGKRMKIMKKKNRVGIDSLSKLAKLHPVNTAFIKSRRGELGLTLLQAAKLAGMSTLVQWHKVEAGKGDPRASTLMRMATALKCKPGDLLNWNEWKAVQNG
jgi:DNA-binding Xre family transcriptional regulator